MTEQSTSEALGDHAGTTVIVSRLVSQPVKEVWKSLVTREAAEALLGPGGVLGDKGDSWHADDGTYGVVRSFHPLEQIRFSWHADEDAPKTLVDLHLLKQSDAETLLELRHEHLPAGADTAALTRRWENALERVAGVA